MEKTFPELRTDRYTSKTLRVVLEYNPKKGLYRIITAYLKWLGR
ncbi:MAG: hypothetical protein PWQ79_2215 [Thermococcaceae archaeon]|nr:hypothetical protein [Thermococcaceae archaeon]